MWTLVSNSTMEIYGALRLSEPLIKDAGGGPGMLSSGERENIFSFFRTRRGKKRDSARAREDRKAIALNSPVAKVATVDSRGV